MPHDIKMLSDIYMTFLYKVRRRTSVNYSMRNKIFKISDSQRRQILTILIPVWRFSRAMTNNIKCFAVSDNCHINLNFWYWHTKMSSPSSSHARSSADKPGNPFYDEFSTHNRFDLAISVRSHTAHRLSTIPSRPYQITIDGPVRISR